MYPQQQYVPIFGNSMTMKRGVRKRSGKIECVSPRLHIRVPSGKGLVIKWLNQKEGGSGAACSAVVTAFHDRVSLQAS